MSDPFLGEIRIFAGLFVPNGWMLCDGATLNQSQYAALFSIIGTIYGGDYAKGTFNLPNLKGFLAMGAGTGPGLTPRPLGKAVTGSRTESLTSYQVPAHTHGIKSAFTGTKDPLQPAPSDTSLISRTFNQWDFADDVSANLPSLAPQAISYTGGGKAHDNTQPILAMFYCISVEGEYPPKP